MRTFQGPVAPVAPTCCPTNGAALGVLTHRLFAQHSSLHVLSLLRCWGAGVSRGWFTPLAMSPALATVVTTDS